MYSLRSMISASPPSEWIAPKSTAPILRALPPAGGLLLRLDLVEGLHEHAQLLRGPSALSLPDLLAQFHDFLPHRIGSQIRIVRSNQMSA